MCAMWASSDVRCRFLGHFFLALSCFGSGGTGFASPGKSASASVPEPCSSRHAPDYISRTFALLVTAYRILFSTIVRDIAVLLVLVVAVSCLAFWRFWETIRVILFYRWFSWGRKIVCPRLMLSFFTKFPAGQCLMMYDDRYWYMETHVSCMSLAVTSNLQIKQNKNLSKNFDPSV